jgi:5-formyltetrahydrofolate cyclo-ligase
MKRHIRKEIIKRRDKLSLYNRQIKDTKIKERLFSLPEYLSAQMVLLYASFRSEVETMSIIRESIAKGKRVVVPKVDAEMHMLRLYEIKNTDELHDGYMGIPEPVLRDERIVPIEDIDLIIVPGTAFDFSGNRLGYGGGYYDILLSKRSRKIPAIALAYEEQLVDSIPSEEHDINVDMIVTDKRIISI